MSTELTPLYMVFLPLLGMAVATIGTLAGLGGGFVLVPILILLFPDASPATLTTISLTVVFLNAGSATVGNVRARRIDFRTAMLLLVGAVPAAVAGSSAARVVSRDSYESIFGAVLLVGAVYIWWRSTKANLPNELDWHEPNRLIRERRGPIYRFYVNGLLAGVISPIAGFISSFFGIGGGIIHVPSLTFILKVPLRVASATSLLVLVPTSLTGVLTLLASGQIHEGWRRAGLIGGGALIGSQIGVYLGARISPKLILTILSLAMVIVGVRQIVAGLS